MPPEEESNKCRHCGGDGIYEGESCIPCLGTGYVSSLGVGKRLLIINAEADAIKAKTDNLPADISTVLNDLADAVNDVMDKCNDIFAVTVPPHTEVFKAYLIVESVDTTEYSGLTDSQKLDFLTLVSAGAVDISDGSTGRSVLMSLFGAGTTTRANLLALLD